ncbi:MAG: GntR family transcriptional regulator [Lachnospiraceae bacterium]|nr:GntR family transcriptional regulator [Lachnospiraceae bacterium]MBR1876259.1 GntR family transcriptional regulator [Lachnospiraceae bacterium]
MGIGETTVTSFENEGFLPLRDVVFNKLRDEILYGELKPGERLMEIAISERLGVSRTPVREAIRKLEQEGLVDMYPRRGAQVSGITEKALADALEARKTLETFTVNAACSRITKEQVDELKQANSDFKETIRTGGAAKIASADEKFHNIIIEAARNVRIAETLYNLKEQLFRYRYAYLTASTDHYHLAHEHDMLIGAIENANSDLAVEIIKLHIEQQSMELFKTIKKNNG